MIVWAQCKWIVCVLWCLMTRIQKFLEGLRSLRSDCFLFFYNCTYTDTGISCLTHSLFFTACFAESYFQCRPRWSTLTHIQKRGCECTGNPNRLSLKLHPFPLIIVIFQTTSQQHWIKDLQYIIVLERPCTTLFFIKSCRVQNSTWLGFYSSHCSIWLCLFYGIPHSYYFGGGVCFKICLVCTCLCFTGRRLVTQYWF